MVHGCFVFLHLVKTTTRRLVYCSKFSNNQGQNLNPDLTSPSLSKSLAGGRGVTGQDAAVSGWCRWRMVVFRCFFARRRLYEPPERRATCRWSWLYRSGLQQVIFCNVCQRFDKPRGCPPHFGHFLILTTSHNVLRADVLSGASQLFAQHFTRIGNEMISEGMQVWMARCEIIMNRYSCLNIACKF